MRLRLLGLAVLLAGLACDDSTGVDRSDRYEWWIVDGTDTLTFHWQAAELPVKIWVEDSANLPAQINRGIGLWQNTLGTNAYHAVTVTDSSTADVIVRVAPILAAAPATGAGRSLTSCQAETIVDTVATRFQLAIPLRINIEILAAPASDSAQACVRRVAAHELGHSLGLFQHSPNNQDLMYSVPTVDAPSARDANTVITLYAAPRTMVPIRVPAAAPGP
jgi:predicted Zn-dependent protease